MKTKIVAYGRRPDIVISGILIYKGRTQILNIESSRMVLDLRSHMLSIAVVFEDQSKRCEDANDAQEDIAKARILRDWIADPHGTVTHEFEFLTPRQGWNPLVVRRGDLDEYLAKLIASRRDLAGQPSFLFDVDGPVPVLYALKQLSKIAHHCGPDVLGYTVHTQELRNLINEHTMRQQMNSDEWRMGGEEPPPSE